jgi:hypothetical protein
VKGEGGSSDPPRVFINYRRDDAAGHAGRLYDALSARFGSEHVFMDVDAIRPGENFATVLDQSVGSCDVLIALIGRRWSTAVDREGRRRLERPEDYVRLELQTALASGRTRVIPALVQGAEMPASDELPEPMRDLAMRQAIELSDMRWRSDVERLIRELEGAALDSDTTAFGRVPRTTATDRRPPPGREPGGHRRAGVAAAVAALLVSAAALAVVLTRSGPDSPAGGAAARTSATPSPTPARTATATPTATPKPTEAPADELKYTAFSTDGYQTRLPSGPDWSRPGQTSYGDGRRVRTTVQGPGGAFVAVDYTPRDKPAFESPYESKSTVILPAFGEATRYVFRGGGVAQCERWKCVDYQVSIPDTEGGVGLVAGGPDFSQTSAIARTVAESLAPAAN